MYWIPARTRQTICLSIDYYVVHVPDLPASLDCCMYYCAPGLYNYLLDAEVLIMLAQHIDQLL